MKKINEKYNNFTLAQLESMLKAKVDEHNLATDAKTRNDLEFEYKEIIDAYNVTSLLTVFADALKCTDKSPIAFIVETYGYETVKVKETVQTVIKDDGTKNSIKMRSVEYSKTAMDLFEFIEWAEDCNKTVTADRRWRTANGNARQKCVDEIKKDIESKDGYKMSKTKIKNALNELFDALVFIPTEKGENALMANGDAANVIKHFGNTVKEKFMDNGPSFAYNVLPERSWKKLVMQIMHNLLSGKEFVIVLPDIEKECAEIVEADAE